MAEISGLCACACWVLLNMVFFWGVSGSLGDFFLCFSLCLSIRTLKSRDTLTISSFWSVELRKVSSRLDTP